MVGGSSVEDLSRTSVFHFFVRMTALVYTGFLSAKVGCLSYVRGCWPAPPRAVWRVFIRKFYILTFSGWRCIIQQQQPGSQYTQASLCSAGAGTRLLGDSTEQQQQQQQPA